MLNRSEFLFRIYIIVLSVIGIFTSEIHIPAFKQIQNALGTTEGMTGLTVSVYMLGLAVGQLVYGPLSDIKGRKLTLSVGMILFVVSSIGCIYVTSIEELLAFRFLQAIGASAAYVLWQPIVIDSFEPGKVQKVFATTVAFVGLSPALAPLIGGFVTSIYGWQYIFKIIFVISGVLLVTTLFLFDETKKNRTDVKSLVPVIEAYRTLQKDPVFWGVAITAALNVALYMVYVTIIPFVLIESNWSPEQIGMIFLPIAVCFMLGSIVSKPFVAKNGETETIKYGAILALVGCIAIFFASLLGSIASGIGMVLVVLFLAVAFFNGFVLPNSMSVLMQRHSQIAGTCASGMGFLMSILTVATTAIGVFLGEKHGYKDVLGVELAVLALCMVVAFVIVRQDITKQNADDGKERNVIEAQS